ncbi:MAG: hypothetical protein QXN26_03680 [Thermoplasmataceae archaeon]
MPGEDRLILAIAVSAIYSVVSATVATSVILTTEALGYRISLFGIVAYALVIGSDVVIMYFSSRRLLYMFTRLVSDRPTVEPREHDTDRGELNEELQLGEREQIVVDAIRRNGGSALQNSLVEVTGMSSPTISRVISSLESKGILEKRRHGMTNIVSLTGGRKR